MYSKILEDYGFLTVAKYSATLGEEYIGIISNQDAQITSMYVFNLLRSDEEKKLFLEYGSRWWWETNRSIPIDIALREWGVFKHTLKTFSTKEFEIVSGPHTSLDNILTKRIKRKQIELVKKIK